MSKPRNEDVLILILKKLAEKESFKLNYVFNHLDKISNIYGIRLTEAEKIILIKYRNKNRNNPKSPFSMDLKR